MIISLAKIKYNDDTRMHRNVLYTVKTHFAIYLPPSTLKVMKLNFDLEMVKELKEQKSQLEINILEDSAAKADPGGLKTIEPQHSTIDALATIPRAGESQLVAEIPSHDEDLRPQD